MKNKEIKAMKELCEQGRKELINLQSSKNKVIVRLEEKIKILKKNNIIYKRSYANACSQIKRARKQVAEEIFDDLFHNSLQDRTKICNMKSVVIPIKLFEKLKQRWLK